MILVVFLFIAAFGVLVALVSLMGLFLGAISPDLAGLLIMLLAGLPLVLGAVFLWVRQLNLALDNETLSGKLWQGTPRWLLVALSLVLSLMLLAELAIFLVQSLSGQQPTWEYYIPIVTGSTYAVSFCLLYVCWNYANSP